VIIIEYSSYLQPQAPAAGHTSGSRPPANRPCSHPPARPGSRSPAVLLSSTRPPAAGPSKPLSSVPTATQSQPPSGKDSGLDERLECCICFETKREIVFLPCRHMVCCNKCSTTVQECPMCRVTIADKFSVYLS
jgi:Zinc finger, C3HC4 type (RING finger)